LEEGAKVRILVYDAQGESYVKHIDYQIDSEGDLEGEKLILDSGKEYTVYIMSFNSSYLPESTDLSIPYEVVKDEYGEEKWPDFLYQKIENYTPDNALNIKLRHRISRININTESMNPYYCKDPEDSDTCIQLAKEIDYMGARVYGLHFPKGTIDIGKGIVLPSGESKPMTAYEIYYNFPVIVSPEYDKAYMEVKIIYSNGYEPVLKIPLPKIPRGMKLSYSIGVKNMVERVITCKELLAKSVGENIIDVEGECNVEGFQNGDRVELSVVENDYGKDEKEIFVDKNYKPGNKFKFQSHMLTNCFYVGYNRDKEIVQKIKIFNSIGLVVGEYNIDDLVGMPIYTDVLCREYFAKIEDGYCMDLEATNYGEHDDCEYNDEGDGSGSGSTPRREPSFCEKSDAINYGGKLPCKQILIESGDDISRDFLVCDGEDGVYCKNASAQTFTIPIEILSSEEFKKNYKLEVNILKNYPKGYLKDPIFQIRDISKDKDREDSRGDFPDAPYENVWYVEIAQNYVPHSEIERMNTNGTFVIEINVREISTNLVVASTKKEVHVSGGY